MTDTMTILGIAGSLRIDSYKRAALRAAQHLTPAGTQIEIFHIPSDLAVSISSARMPAPRSRQACWRSSSPMTAHG